MNSALKLINDLKYLKEANLKSAVIQDLREIRLKSSDGTNLQQTKLGGKPNWIQNDETPVCPQCRERMKLIAQIDSFDDNWQTLKGNNRFYFGDNGRIYVFFPYCDCGEEPIAIGQYF